ncbi:ATP-binding cassette domain-containing protein [Pseudotabrizicola sp. 4114]|uniref:ATP-binding cassette domain-containing protein n=1 Tax=Pseudotabrizicola sp. 4114 TaxID=2817731 RepID=UPI002861EFE4|nr:ABC-type branched-subunit amino acid transport system ATPase component [Pseudorhodobacter sp. 4114]
MFEVRSLHSGYGNIPILKGLDLTIADTEFVSIYGHNGMGKTTLLRALIGLLPVNSGKHRFPRPRYHQGSGIYSRKTWHRLCSAGQGDHAGALGA